MHIFLSHIYNYPPDINMSQLLLDPLWFQLKNLAEAIKIAN